MRVRPPDFVISSFWDQGHWSATTFRWDMQSKYPPLMGLVFDNSGVGRRIFEDWTARHGNSDPLEEIRVAIIEDEAAGMWPGYTVHLSGEAEDILSRAALKGDIAQNEPVPWISRVNRMSPEVSSPSLLVRFKEEFAKHQEYLLAPVTHRGDGQLWFDVELGIVKHKIHFRHISEIADDDIDAVVKLARP